MKKKLFLQSGQALITFLIFIVVALTVTSTATVLFVSNSQATTKMELGLTALSIAESGAENAILRLLRDPSYTGETLSVNSGTATVAVTGTNPKTITSTGQTGNFTRTVQVVVSYSSILTITSWKEMY